MTPEEYKNYRTDNHVTISTSKINYKSTRIFSFHHWQHVIIESTNWEKLKAIYLWWKWWEKDIFQLQNWDLCNHKWELLNFDPKKQQPITKERRINTVFTVIPKIFITEWEFIKIIQSENPYKEIIVRSWEEVLYFYVAPAIIWHFWWKMLSHISFEKFKKWWDIWSWYIIKTVKDVNWKDIRIIEHWEYTFTKAEWKILEWVRVKWHYVKEVKNKWNGYSLYLCDKTWNKLIQWKDNFLMYEKISDKEISFVWMRAVWYWWDFFNVFLDKFKWYTIRTWIQIKPELNRMLQNKWFVIDTSRTKLAPKAKDYDKILFNEDNIYIPLDARKWLINEIKQKKHLDPKFNNHLNNKYNIQYIKEWQSKEWLSEVYYNIYYIRNSK